MKLAPTSNVTASYDGQSTYFLSNTLANVGMNSDLSKKVLNIHPSVLVTDTFCHLGKKVSYFRLAKETHLVIKQFEVGAEIM